MRERPILFSGPMVRAILDGTKTQTRRVVKPAGALLAMSWSPLHPERGLRVTTRTGKHSTHTGPVSEALSACPYGEPGDRLWVRETWGLHGHGDYTWWCRDSIKGRTADDLALSYEVAYAADATSEYDHWRPSIHMPRWASRLTLEVTSVRVERLHAITEDDARAEGVDWSRPEPYGERWDDDREDPREVGYPPAGASFARDNFRRLWSSINRSESWAANPWVWVVGFKRVEVRHG